MRREKVTSSLVQPTDLSETCTALRRQPLGTARIPGGGGYCPWVSVYSEVCIDNLM